MSHIRLSDEYDVIYPYIPILSPYILYIFFSFRLFTPTMAASPDFRSDKNQEMLIIKSCGPKINISI